MKPSHFFHFVVLGLLLTQDSGWAYEQDTHMGLSGAAANATTLNDGELTVIRQLGLEYPINNDVSQSSLTPRMTRNLF